MRPGLRAPLVAATVAGVVYLPSLGGGFLYDDLQVVVENRSIRDLSQLGTVLRFDPARPLLNLSWALSYAAGGLAPWHWHLVNVLLHAACAALAASLFARLAPRLRHPDPEGAALAAACLFAATPMACETVAYVASRSTLLSGALSLAALRTALPGLETGSKRALGGGLVLFALALAAKEEAAAVPLLLLLIDALVLSGGRLEALRGRLPRHLPFFALLVGGLVGRRLVTGAWLPPPIMDRGLYLLTQLAVFTGYLLRAVAPLDPAFYRGTLPATWPPGLLTVAGAAVTLALVAAAVALRRRRPELSLAVLWMGAALLPSSSLVPLQEMVVDHRAYLGGAGVCLALGLLLWRPGRGRLAAALLVLLAGRALHYQWVMADPVRVWSDAVARAPTSLRARLSLADAHAARGEDEQAERRYREALRLDPYDFYAAANLGGWLAGQGRLVEAVEALRVASRARPQDARVRDNLGLLLLATGREQEARRELEAAVAGSPPLAQPRINLAALLLRSGERERAARLLDEAAALEIDARDAQAIEELRERLR